MTPLERLNQINEGRRYQLIRLGDKFGSRKKDQHIPQPLSQLARGDHLTGGRTPEGKEIVTDALTMEAFNDHVVLSGGPDMTVQMEAIATTSQSKLSPQKNDILLSVHQETAQKLADFLKIRVDLEYQNENTTETKRFTPR